MNSPAKHHFVPKCYLKEFSNSQLNLYQLTKGRKEIISRNIGQICFETNFFKIHSDDLIKRSRISDPYHIEKNHFKKQENSYPKLVRKISVPSFPWRKLFKSELLLFIETLITIKRRNPSYKGEIIENLIGYLKSKEFKEESKIAIEIARKVDPFDPVEYLEKYLKDVFENRLTQSDMYLQIFLDIRNTSSRKSAEMLLKYKTFLLVAPIGKQFLTSDNPGFTVLKSENRISNFGGFGVPFKFYFPITPTSCLYIDNDFITDSLAIERNLEIKYVNSKELTEINACTIETANKRIFSYSKDNLAEYIELSKANAQQKYT